MAFTLVFEGDIRSFPDNPLKTQTPFGVPYAVGVGDAFETLETYAGIDEAAHKIVELTKKLSDD